MSISEQRAEQALRYLAETDAECARLESYFNGLDRMKSPVRSEAFNASLKVSNGERDHESYASMAYKNHLAAMALAEEDYLKVKLKRETEKLVWEHWRSVNKNKREGVVM